MFESIAVEEALSQLGTLLIAFTLALPMAWDRERADQSMGLRTFPLVSVSACAFVLVAQTTFQDQHAISRVMEGVIAGVGFLGGGAIVKHGLNVRGAATAAAVWTTAALGLSVARGELGIAIGLAAIGFATLRWLRPLKRVAQEREDAPERESDQGEGRGSRSRETSAAPAPSKSSGDTVANAGR